MINAGWRKVGTRQRLPWSQTLGGILHVAGVPGFLGNLDEVMEASDSEGGT